MPESVHEKLREMLDIHPMGCPPSPEIIEILKILFTKDEARVALGLGFRPFTVDEIAARAGVESETAGLHLESLADKGMVFARQKNDVWVSISMHGETTQRQNSISKRPNLY